MRGFAFIWALWVLLALAANVAIFYIVLHFVAKYW